MCVCLCQCVFESLPVCSWVPQCPSILPTFTLSNSSLCSTTLQFMFLCVHALSVCTLETVNDTFRLSFAFTGLVNFFYNAVFHVFEVFLWFLFFCLLHSLVITCISITHFLIMVYLWVGYDMVFVCWANKKHDMHPSCFHNILSASTTQCKLHTMTDSTVLKGTCSGKMTFSVLESISLGVWGWYQITNSDETQSFNSLADWKSAVQWTVHSWESWGFYSTCVVSSEVLVDSYISF